MKRRSACSTAEAGGGRRRVSPARGHGPRRWRGEAGLRGGYQGLGDGALAPGFGSLGRGAGGMRIPSTAWGHGETASGTQEAGAHEAASPRPPGSRLVFVSRPVAGAPARAAGAVCGGDRAERAGTPEGTRTRGPPSRGLDRAAPFRIEPLSSGKTAEDAARSRR